VGKFKEPISSLVGDSLVRQSQGTFGHPAIVGSLFLTGQGTIGLLDSVDLLFEKLGRLYLEGFKTIMSGQERLQPEIKPRHLTGRGDRAWKFLLQSEAEVQIIQPVTFDRNCLDLTNDIPVFAVLENTVPDFDLISIQELPACLLERKALEFANLAERGRGGSDAVFEVTKEKPIAFFNALCNILQRLRVERFQPGVLRKFLEFGQMLHQGILVQMLPGQFVIPLVQGNTMIVRFSRQVDRPMQVLILFVAIQLILVRHDHWFF
jgi:hypothetical protein